MNEELPEVTVEFVMYPGVKFQCPSCHMEHNQPDPRLALLIDQGKVITATCKCGADFKLKKSMLVVPK